MRLMGGQPAASNIVLVIHDRSTKRRLPCFTSASRSGPESRSFTIRRIHMIRHWLWGFDGADVAVFGLFLPFNAASVLFWFVMLRWLWRKFRQPAAGGVVIEKHGWKTRVPLPELTPVGL